MDSFRILQCWAACAWADGELHPAEAAALTRLIGASDDLSGEQLGRARALLAGPADLDLLSVKALRPESREGVYRAALGIVKLDRQVTDDERAFLVRLRDALALDADTVARIDAE